MNLRACTIVLLVLGSVGCSEVPKPPTSIPGLPGVIRTPSPAEPVDLAGYNLLDVRHYYAVISNGKSQRHSLVDGRLDPTEVPGADLTSTDTDQTEKESARLMEGEGPNHDADGSTAHVEQLERFFRRIPLPVDQGDQTSPEGGLPVGVEQQRSGHTGVVDLDAGRHSGCVAEGRSLAEDGDRLFDETYRDLRRLA